MQNLTRRDWLKAGTAAVAAPWCLGWNPAWAQQEADPYADGILVAGEPPAIEKGSFTIAVLPDTQHYSDGKAPQNFPAQTEWLVKNKQARNISCVLHLGDITNNNVPEHWERAKAAMEILDGELPYFMVPGNHDYGPNGRCADRTTMMEQYFPVSKFADLPTFGGVYDKEPDKMQNSWHLFEANGRKFLVLGLEFGPRGDVVRWANEVVAQYPDREAILITHAYMYCDDTRYDLKKYGEEQKWNPHIYGVAKPDDDVNDGTELWDKLVSRHENFIMTLNGHVLFDGLGRMTSTTPGGRDVHQILVNFQMRPNGGDSFLRLMEFKADGKTVQMYDYAPSLNKHNQSAQNQFAVTLSAPGGVATAKAAAT